MWYLGLAERGRLPDSLVRAFMAWLNWRQLQSLRTGGPEAQQNRYRALVEQLLHSPIAVATEKANQQHYELPPRFFELVLGPRLKYSSAYFPAGVTSLAQAEEAMLELYLERARLADGQRILELGCGWGSLTLKLAERFPAARIVAVSNSNDQRTYLEAKAMPNLEILTCDMNHFVAEGRFDRIVSVEMFEHMRNYAHLFGRVHQWLRPGGLAFLHVFCHRLHPYLFEVKSEADWIERYFFTGGTMPSVDLLPNLAHPLRLQASWLVDGTHYQKTANAWLANLDARETEVRRLLAEVYPDPDRWWVYWRLFFLACAELFGYRRGQEWMVVHHLLARD